MDFTTASKRRRGLYSDSSRPSAAAPLLEEERIDLEAGHNSDETAGLFPSPPCLGLPQLVQPGAALLLPGAALQPSKHRSLFQRLGRAGVSLEGLLDEILLQSHEEDLAAEDRANAIAKPESDSESDRDVEAGPQVEVLQIPASELEAEQVAYKVTFKLF